MIPFLLAAVGGYLIGDSMKDSDKFADGGEVRKIKGVNFSAQIENSRKFKELIQRVYDNQSGERYPLEFITAIARGKNSIVKHDGKNYVKGYSHKGTISHFEFLNDPTFVRALEYVDRPSIRKFSEGGVMEKTGRLHMRVEPSTFEEDMEEARMKMGKYWNTLTEQEKIEATKYLKSKGEVGHMGQEEDVETFMANLNYKKGGKLK